MDSKLNESDSVYPDESGQSSTGFNHPGGETMTIDAGQDTPGIGRREFAINGPARLIVLAALAKMGILNAEVALAQETGETELPQANSEDSANNDPSLEYQELKEEAEHLVHDSMSLRVLDIVGSLGFIDAIIAIAKQKDSNVQKLCMMVGLPTYNTGELEDSHDAKFPLENIHFAAILNVIRALSFGKEVREHTLHEFFTTLKGVGLLLGLTSVAKGIVAVEGSAEHMAHANAESISMQPETVIARSIFQLTVVAAATQLPLTAFGNAAIGNGEFPEVKESFKNIYLRSLRGVRAETEMYYVLESVRSYANSLENKVVKKNILEACDEGVTSLEDLRTVLIHKSESHANDLMVILMSTACDDAQAAAGDAGPLVGLYQSYGTDFLYAVPSILPYTMLIGVERAIFAAKRAGIDPKSVLTKENMEYMKEFTKVTWKNLFIYFTKVAPKIASRITGQHGTPETPNNDTVGRDFSLLEQILKDISSMASSVGDAVLGSFNGNTLDIRKVRSAIHSMQSAEEDFHAELGRQVMEKYRKHEEDEGSVIQDNAPQEMEEGEELPLRKAGIQEIRERLVGQYSSHNELREIQLKIEELTLADDSAIESFAKELKASREAIGPLLQEQLDQLEAQGGKTPSIQEVAKLLKANPKVSELLDFNYWHHRIGPELTDTMFVVFLQGLHLPFIINTVEKYFYGSEAFKSLPLAVQEWVSVALNDFVSMFADNWADAVAHSKWLTSMYFNKLDQHIEALKEDYPEIEATLDKGFFEDSSTQIVPERFKRRREQLAALVEHLKERHPGDSEKLEEVRDSYFEDSHKYYWKSMIMSMLTAVTGGGKALTGNAPHFTFAANQEDYDLAETLSDFKRHPVYHLWEFLFSTGYSTMVGPVLAQGLGGILGKSASNEVKKMMQERFKKQFPEFEKKLNELKAKENQLGAANQNPTDVQSESRRAFFGRLGKMFKEEEAA